MTLWVKKGQSMRYMISVLLIATLCLSGCTTWLSAGANTEQSKLEKAIENAKTVLEACDLALSLYEEFGKPEDAEKIATLRIRIAIVQNYLDKLLDGDIAAADLPPWEEPNW